MSGSNGSRNDWADVRVRGLIDKAKTRRQEWREVDLEHYDLELAGQTLQVWANAPRVIGDFIAKTELGDPHYISALSELTQYSESVLRDMIDAWEPALTVFIMQEVFGKIREYQQERLDFLSLRSSQALATS